MDDWVGVRYLPGDEKLHSGQCYAGKLLYVLGKLIGIVLDYF